MKNTNVYHIIYTNNSEVYLEIITTVKGEEAGTTTLSPLEFRIDPENWANWGPITIETKNLVPGKRIVSESVSESHTVECEIIGDISDFPEYLL